MQRGEAPQFGGKKSSIKRAVVFASSATGLSAGAAAGGLMVFHSSMMSARAVPN
jgi:hypothetical protein